MKTIGTILLILHLIFTISCTSNRKHAENHPATIVPKDLPAYFDSLVQSGLYIPYHTDSSQIKKVEEGILQLQKYQSGERKFYPAEEVQTALEIMRHELGYINSHRGEELTEEDDGFFFHFLEQAARLCPDLHLLADVTSADNKIGVINFHEWSYNPLYSFLLNENGTGGWNVSMIGEAGNVKIEKIFLLQHDGQTYYLLSNNETLVTFTQFICTIEEGTASLSEGLQFTEAFNQWHEDIPDDYTIVFNPRKICWNFCHNAGEYDQPIENTKTLYLELDKNQSRFHVQ